MELEDRIHTVAEIVAQIDELRGIGQQRADGDQKENKGRGAGCFARFDQPLPEQGQGQRGEAAHQEERPRVCEAALNYDLSADFTGR